MDFEGSIYVQSPNVEKGRSNRKKKGHFARGHHYAFSKVILRFSKKGGIHARVKTLFDKVFPIVQNFELI